jgi:uncharacterized protein (DUF3820 family)
MTDQGNVVPFGKYKGRLIEELLIDDPGYLQWLVAQDWFRAKYVTLHQVIINRGAEPEETPEHNALQVLFLDDDFCVRFMEVVDPRLMDKIRNRLENRRKEHLRYLDEKIKDQEEKIQRWGGGGYYYNSSRWGEERDLSELWDEHTKYSMPVEIVLITSVAFEEHGIDVTISILPWSRPHPYQKYEYDRVGNDIKTAMTMKAAIEIKPAVSDNYPAVLRQMRANESTILFLEQYTGSGATREQFIKTFASANIAVVFKDQVQ